MSIRRLSPVPPTASGLARPARRWLAAAVCAFSAAWAGAPLAQEAEIDAAALYADHCSVCHGEKGDGDSHARQGMSPPPRDFTSPGARGHLTRESMIAAVAHGRPGTAMVGWAGRLEPREIDAVVDFIRERFMRPPPAVASAPQVDSPGRRIYDRTCSVCHGEDGAGAVWGRSSLDPPPVNFRVQDPVNAMTRARMIASVTHGRPGTAMTAFGSTLTGEQIEAVVDYIRDAFMFRTAPAAAAGPAPRHATTVGAAVMRGDDLADRAAAPAYGNADPDSPFPDGLRGDYDTGHAYYRMNCAACHGAEGDGAGPRAYFIFPRPRDFRSADAQARLNRPALFQAIKHGVLGREMPAWGKVLSDQQIADVAEYVFRRYVHEGAAAAAPAP